MKKTLLLTATFLALSLLSSSCSSDGSPNAPDENELAVGTYGLVELNINPAQDINEDGNTTTNVLTELPCATGNLTLNNDGT